MTLFNGQHWTAGYFRIQDGKLVKAPNSSSVGAEDPNAAALEVRQRMLKKNRSTQSWQTRRQNRSPVFRDEGDTILQTNNLESIGERVARSAASRK